MDQFTIFSVLFLVQYHFTISNCGEIANLQNKLETNPSVDENQTSAQSEYLSVDKSKESSGEKKSNATKPGISYKDALNKSRDSDMPGQPILVKPPFEGKNLNNTASLEKLVLAKPPLEGQNLNNTASQAKLVLAKPPLEGKNLNNTEAQEKLVLAKQPLKGKNLNNTASLEKLVLAKPPLEGKNLNNTEAQAKLVLAKPPLEGKNLNNTEAQAKLVLAKTPLKGKNLNNTEAQAKLVLAKPPLEGKNLNNTKVRSVPTNVDGNKTKQDEQKTKVKDFPTKKKTEKSEYTKNIFKKIYNKARMTSNGTIHPLPTLSSTSSTSFPVGNQRSSAILNPKAATFIPGNYFPKISPNAATTPPQNSADSKELSLNPNAPTFQPNWPTISPNIATTPPQNLADSKELSLNPNAPTFQPNWPTISPNIATTPPQNSADSKELSLNPNAPTFQPKIYPIGREMSLLSDRMRKIEPDYPLFEERLIFPQYLIVTYDCLHASKNPSDDPSTITSISIFESKRQTLVYKGYPEIGEISDPSVYCNAWLLNEVDPKMRKDVATIRKEINNAIKNKIIVGINLGKILSIYKLDVKPFDAREITSLAKYADILNRRPNNIDEAWFKKHKELLVTYLPEMHKELRSIPILRSEDKMKYISILYEKMRQDWENEVLFLKRLFGHYKHKPRPILAQFGYPYPGLHSNRPSSFPKFPWFPEDLVGLHIRYDNLKNFIPSVTAIDFKLNRIFKAFVKNVDGIEKDSKGSVYGRFESIVNYIFEKNFLNPNVIIVGFDVYKLAKILDAGKKLKGTRVYDTKIIFEAQTVTEMALKYLKIDYRYKYLHFGKNFTWRSLHEHPKDFVDCDMRLPIELAARISMQMFRLYTLNQNSKVQELKLWQ